MKLKVMTYNIQHGMDYKTFVEEGNYIINLDLAADVINEEDCDMICLDEVRNKGEDPGYTEQAEILGKKTKRNYIFCKCIDVENKGPYGHALLTKESARNYECIDIPEPEIKESFYEKRKILKTEFALEKDITIFSTHFGLGEQEKINAVQTLVEEIKKVKTPLIVMGDLNMTPDDVIMEPIYKELKEVYVSGGPFTWSSDAPSRKIDYIFVSRDIEIKSVKTIGKVVSDHFPIVAELEI